MPSPLVSIRHNLSLDVQTAADFRLDLNPEDFANIPKEFNMRPHTDGAQSAYSFGHQHGGSVGEPFAAHCAKQISGIQALPLT